MRHAIAAIALRIASNTRFIDLTEKYKFISPRQLRSAYNLVVTGKPVHRKISSAFHQNC